MRLRYLALPAALLALTPTARAKEPGQGPDEPTRYSFEDDQVFADTERPMGEVMMVRRRGQRESLVRVRDSFVVELLQSAEAL